MTPTNTSTPTVTPANTNRTDPKPKFNTIYLGKIDNHIAIFYTTEQSQYYYSTHGLDYLYKGTIQILDGSSLPEKYNKDKDFKYLLDLKEIYSNSTRNISVASFIFNDSRSYLYLSIMLIGKDNEYRLADKNIIIQVDMDKLTYKQIWSTDMSIKYYKSVGGGAKFTNIDKDSSFLPRAVWDDRFLVFWLSACYDCCPSAVGIGVINISTGNLKFLEDIGNVVVRVSENTFTYQKVYPPKTNEGPYVVGNIEGEVFTDTLP